MHNHYNVLPVNTRQQEIFISINLHNPYILTTFAVANARNGDASDL